MDDSFQKAVAQLQHDLGLAYVAYQEAIAAAHARFVQAALAAAPPVANPPQPPALLQPPIVPAPIPVAPAPLTITRVPEGRVAAYLHEKQKLDNVEKQVAVIDTLVRELQQAMMSR